MSDPLVLACVPLVLAVLCKLAGAFGEPLTAALIRAWVRLYTRGLPAEVRRERLAEIESDLWEHKQQARADGYTPGQIALKRGVRLALGVRADLGWRAETRNALGAPPAVTGTGIVVLPPAATAGVGAVAPRVIVAVGLTAVQGTAASVTTRVIRAPRPPPGQSS